MTSIAVGVLGCRVARGSCISGLRGFYRDVLFAAVKMCDCEGVFSAADIRVVLDGASMHDIGGALKALRYRGIINHVASSGGWRREEHCGCWQLPQWLLVDFERIPLRRCEGVVGVAASGSFD